MPVSISIESLVEEETVTQLRNFYILCHQRYFLSSFIDHFSQDFIMDKTQQANNKLFKVDLSADDGSLVSSVLFKQS